MGYLGIPSQVSEKNSVVICWNQLLDILSQMGAIRSQFCPESRIWMKTLLLDLWVNLVRFEEKSGIMDKWHQFWKVFMSKIGTHDQLAHQACNCKIL